MARPAPDVEDLGRAARRICTAAAVAAVREASPLCACPGCASLCRGQPGAYLPAEAARLLARDGGDFVRATVVEYLREDAVAEVRRREAGGGGAPPAGPALLLRPRTLGEAGGAFAPAVCRPAPCVHLGERGCSRGREDMPVECATGYAAGCGRAHAAPIGRDILAALWDSAEGRAVAAAFEAEARAHLGARDLGPRAWGDAVWAASAPEAGLEGRAPPRHALLSRRIARSFHAFDAALARAAAAAAAGPSPFWGAGGVSPKSGREPAPRP